MTALQETRLFEDLIEVLRSFPEGVNEHALLKVLDEKGTVTLEPDTFTDSVKLFRTHFLLYNALYQLRDELWRTGKGHLEITAVRMQLQPYNPGSPSIHQHDPMRDYYLDMDMLEKTTQQDIESALNNFWKRLHEETVFTGGGLKAKALEALGLREGVTAQEIKISYRRLAMQHHPDRGGDQEKLQQINEAMEVLRPLLK
ncbi:MAG: DnaJ domain-containing protein [Marinospirillum sp.]|uniref:DNA-J related domain-containing protein n=1 Tax=Marinospirillum sp. TaxID=2183934 RepID=UPI0019F66834|nr:DNA-J related domain-containing protein [Marinospirillum sp.]MBE0506443.1 DnaJ domain-containing protein [Marinospirillum sp.]